MCKVLNKFEGKETFTGYKLVLKIDGEYYSPSTGLKYEVGMKIPKMKKRGENIDGTWANPLSDGIFYEPLMQGKTSVLDYKIDAIRLLNDVDEYSEYKHDDYVILKMTIGGDMYKGRLNYSSEFKDYVAYTVIGSEILEIEEDE